MKEIHPVVTPETEEEIENWNTFSKIITSSLTMKWESIGSVNFSNYEEKFKHAKAYANFADAKNTDDPISKYERLYKVVESFFNGRGDQFDQNVADFMVEFDSNFVPVDFGVLRKLRNRCVHSKDKRHVTSGDLELLER